MKCISTLVSSLVALLVGILLASPIAAKDGAKSKPLPESNSAEPGIIKGEADAILGEVSLAHPANVASGFETKSRVLTPKLENHAAATFIENKGQWDKRVRFQLKRGGGTLWLTNSGVVFDNVRAKTNERSAANPELKSGLRTPIPHIPDEYERLVFSEDFKNANSAPSIEGIAVQPGKYNYLAGSDPAKWHTGVLSYAAVIYRNVWDGVDVKVAKNGADIEQEFVVHPGADLSRVQVAYRGIEKLETASDGSLLVHTAYGDLTESAPRIYQEVAGNRVSVAGRFTLTNKTSYTFKVESADPQYALVIDPTLLYSTFLGGSVGFGCGPFNCATGESAQAIAVDAAGNAYVTGFTQSLDFPTTPGAFQTSGAFQTAAFVTKLNTTGSQLVYSTYLVAAGASSLTYGYGIALDSAQEPYITGTSAQGTFPTTSNAYGQACGSSFFLAKMNATGDGLIYSTCFGSIYFSNAYGIAVDSSGKAYITGNDTTGGLPTTPGAYQPAYAGANGYGGDAFLTVFDPSASGTASLIYSTYLGGSNDDIGFAVAVDVFGMAYVTGSTQSRNFPVTPGAFQSTYPGAVEDVFVAKFNPSASGATSLIYSTYLGGNGIGPSGSSGYDIGHGIAVDAVGQAHVTGQTGSANFPVTPGAFQTTQLWHSGFITTLNAAGNGLVQSTFLGGSSGDQNSASAIALDSMGDAYLTGTTGAPDFPTTPNAFQPSLAGGLDAFVTELNPAGTALVYSSYLGGTQLNQGNGIAVDAVGDAYVTGFTESLNFPTTPFAFQPVIHTGGAWGPADAFVTKLPLGSPGGLSITGVLPNQGGNAGPATVTIVGSGFHAGAIVKLLGGGGSIVGNPPSVGIEGRTMQTTFDLTAAATGSRDLVVTNPDGTISTLSQGFTVATAGAPDIWLDLLGLPGLRESQPQFYYLVYGNRGNIDSPTLRLWISFDSFLSWNPIPNQNPASQGHLNGRTYLAFDVSPTAGSNGLIPIALTAPNSHQTFLIQAWEEGR